jgi:hypothetical protein
MKGLSIIIFVLLAAGLIPLKSQSISDHGDKFTLLTMPYNRRPLTLYKGELQVNAGYKFAVLSRSFNDDGSLLILKDEGIASVFHYYFAELKYGITDFLQISAQTNYMKRGIRSVTENYITSVSEAIKVNTVTETKGLGDILLLASFRLPVTYKWFDVGVTGGAFVPSAKYQPEKPSHRVSNITSANVFTVDYHFNNKNGYGVPVWLLSGVLKFTASKFSVETDFTYRKPVGEGENIRWEEELTVDKAFSYTTNTFGYLLNSSYDVNASLHYQVRGWLDIRLNSSYHYSAGGWTEYWGNKYQNRPESLFTLEPALEIQISPSLTVYEVAGFPLSGSNIDGPFYLFMTLSFKTFPFFR